MKKSFTIIEVVIAAVILSFLGVALLKNAGLNIDYFERVSKKAQITEFAGIVANHLNPEFNHLKKSLYDFIEKEYYIDDSEIVKSLKDAKFTYIEDELKLDLPSMEDNESKGDNILGIKLKKLSVISENGGDYIFAAELNE
jgi:hypothetical protein